MKSSTKKKFWLIALIVFAVIFVASVVILVINYMPNKEYKKYKKEVSSTAVTSSEEEVLVDNPIDFAELKKQNPDVCAYIQIDGTSVDYPIMRSGDNESEDFYLDHDWLRNLKYAGSIYIQKMNSEKFDDPCTLIYGHNMANGSMLAGIRKYRNPEFFEQNRYVNIYTPGHILKYEIFSAFTHDDRHILKSYNFLDQSDYERFADEAISPKNMFGYNSVEELKPKFGDKIIVLSTCTDSYNDMRYLVCAKLIEDIKTK